MRRGPVLLWTVCSSHYKDHPKGRSIEVCCVCATVCVCVCVCVCVRVRVRVRVG